MRDERRYGRDVRKVSVTVAVRLLPDATTRLLDNAIVVPLLFQGFACVTSGASGAPQVWQRVVSRVPHARDVDLKWRLADHRARFHSSCFIFRFVFF